MKLTDRELADRCEQAAGPNYSLDCQIAETALRIWHPGSVPAFTASLDAAMMLVSDRDLMAVWRGMLACLGCDGVTRADLPRLICVAALRARATNQSIGA